MLPRRKRRLPPKPPDPPEGMMWLYWRLVPIEDAEERPRISWAISTSCRASSAIC
jgi:hypothetical protein